jgi:hypothetical protein
MNQFRGESILSLNQESVIAIDSAMKGYLAVLEKRSPILSDRIQKLGALRLKFAPFIVPGGFPEGIALFLSHQELQLIMEAMGGFIESTRLIIPPSRQRDAVLQEFEKLREYVQRSFAQDMN